MNHTKLLCLFARPRISPVTPSTSLNSVNRLVFVERLEFVFCDIKTGLLYTVWSKRFRTDFFKSKTHVEDT
jgi:hypothetical protein